MRGEGAPCTYPTGPDWEWVAGRTHQSEKAGRASVSHLELERAIAGAYLHCDRRIEEVQQGRMTILNWDESQFRAADVAEILIEQATIQDPHRVYCQSLCRLTLVLIRGGRTRRLALCEGSPDELQRFAGRIWSVIAAAPGGTIDLKNLKQEAQR